jgi:hypothetical protein
MIRMMHPPSVLRKAGMPVRFALVALATILSVAPRSAYAQYSVTELTTSASFPASAQNGFGKPIATDGTYYAFATGNALYSREIKKGSRKTLFAAGDILPRSGVKASIIYPQVIFDGGLVVFFAAENTSDDSVYGLYAVKEDGSAAPERVFDSTQVAGSSEWSSAMDQYAYAWPFQASHGVAVIALGGSLYAANLNGSDVRTLWQANLTTFKGCQTEGDYHVIFQVNQVLPTAVATNGKSYAFGGGSLLDFVGLYQGALTQTNSCDNLINSRITIDDTGTTPVITLPGQPRKAGPFAFGNESQSIQIDGDYVYFGASVPEGVSSTEDYTGYFRIPLAGGKAEALVTNISHVPGIETKGKFDQVWLLGFAAKNGKFVFMAQDAAPGNPGTRAIYMLEGSKYVTLFSSGTSVSNVCAGALDAEYAAPGALNQVSLSSTGLLTFGAEVLPAAFPDKSGPCSYQQGDYIHDPIGYFLLDTTHPLIPTETEIKLSVAEPVVYGEKPSLKIKVMPAADAKNPKDLFPTGTVTVWYTNPEYFGAQQPLKPTATLNSDGEATISLGALAIGTYTYVVSYGGDENFSSSASADLVFPLHVSAPTFSVKGGTYKSAQSVTLGDATPGATIYYTTNNTTPTAKSKEFVNAIPVTGKETIKAIAVAAGDANSAVITESYIIK